VNIGWQGLVIFVVALLIVFGVTRWPEIVRSLHRAQQEFRGHARTAAPAREHPEDVGK
jgi:Sec-independent protein translocase protein TatA